MTQPLDAREQMQLEWFKPRHNILITFGMSKFDACWKIEKGKFVQYMRNLPDVEDDIHGFKKCLAKYNVHEWEELKLPINPTEAQVEDVMHNLQCKIENGNDEKPPINYLVIFLFAGHGMWKEGKQVLLYNEYDQET